MADNSDSVDAQNDPLPTRIQSTSRACIALPPETIYHIFRYLEPRDLIRIQAVSKLFRAIINDPVVWRATYTTVRLPLPPGPFPWQSARFLQRALIRSTQLARVWTTEPLTLIEDRVFTGPRSIETDRFKWVRGRWLIVSKGMKRLESRDVETDARQLLWDHGAFTFWAASSVMCSAGHFVYIAVHLGKGHVTDPVKLLEFRADNDTGRLSGPEILDVPTWALPKEAFIPRIRVDSGMAPYVYISLCSANKPRQSLIFDPRYRRWYKFPRFRTRLDLLLNYRGAWLPHLVEVYFMRTHLFVLNRSYLIHGNVGNVEVIQVFTLPDINDDPDPIPGPNRDSVPDGLVNSGGEPVVRELHLTHESHSRDTASLWLYPIRTEVVDPVTQSTTLRFIHTYAPIHHTPTSRARLVCTDYILPPCRPGPARIITPTTVAKDGLGNAAGSVSTPTIANNHTRSSLYGDPSFSVIVRSTEEVFPITAMSHGIFDVLGVWNGNLVDTSVDGFVRGMCMVGRYAEGSQIPDLGMVHKFTVDATGERCVAEVGEACPPWEGLNTSRCYEYAFDGMRGKMWRTKGDVLEMDMAGRPVDKETLAIVLDFK